MERSDDEIEKIDLLLVDDRRENLLALEAVLDSPHYHLILANSGDEALRYLLHHEPALILMDVQMPNLDGFETVSIIKRSERTRDIPVIFVTAINKDDRYTYEGYKHGAVDYIFKPYDTEILRSKVAVFADLARKTKKLLRAEKTIFENEAKDRERQIAQLELKGLRREQLEQKKYRDLVDGINHGIVWSANPDTFAFDFVSSSSERILGYTSEDWQQEQNFLLNRMPPEDKERFLSAVREVCRFNHELSVEHRLYARDGRVVWMHTGLRLGQRTEENQSELRALSIDITSAKVAEVRARRDKERSDFLAEASLILSKSLNQDNTLIELASLAVPRQGDWFSIHVIEGSEEGKHLKTLASQCSNPHYQNWRHFFSENASPGFFSAETAIATGTPILIPNLTALRQGTAASAHDHSPEEGLQIAPLIDAGIRSAMIVPLCARGETFGALGFALGSEPRERDLHLNSMANTLSRPSLHSGYDEWDFALAQDLALRVGYAIDNARLYRQAQSAIQARDEFLSIASHELKTPLTPLKIQVQSLLRNLRTKNLDEVQPEKLKRMLDGSERQLGRLSKLIDDLLDVSRISNGKLTLNIEEFDLNELLRDLVDRYRTQLISAGCSLHFEGKHPIIVRWDRLRTEQVATNLLTNAMKYGAGKPILISTASENGKVRIAFKDHGIGIAPEDRRRIFERFERVLTRNHVHGMGLGLYIVTQILEAHGGTINIQSEIGKGSEFIVEIPKQVESTGFVEKAL